jgi:hypothetical protein
VSYHWSQEKSQQSHVYSAWCTYARGTTCPSMTLLILRLSLRWMSVPWDWLLPVGKSYGVNMPRSPIILVSFLPYFC